MKQFASKAAALLILFVLLAALWQLLVAPVWSAVTSQRTEMAQYLERTVRQQVIEGRALEYTKWLEKYPERNVLDRVYSGRTVNAAETLMQRDLSTAAQSVGATVNSVETAPSKKAADFMQMTLRVNLSGNSEQFLGLLKKIQENPKAVTVSKCSVRVRRQEDELGPADLAVSLEIVAYAKI